MGGGVRVGRAVGRALASGTAAAGSSKGVRGRKRPTAVRASASGMVWYVWRLGRQRKAFVCSSSGVWDGRSVGYGKLLVLVLPGQHGRWRQGRKRDGGGKGVDVGWQRRQRQLWCRRQGWKMLLALVRALKSGKAAGNGIGVGDSVNEGVGVGDSVSECVGVWDKRGVGVRDSVSEWCQGQRQQGCQRQGCKRRRCYAARELAAARA